MEKIMTYETLRNFTYSNDKLIEGEIKGVVLSFMGLNFNRMIENSAEGSEYAERGILYVIPYYNPWCWMNAQAVSLVDEILDVLFDHYQLSEDTPIVSSGGSMGGLCALTYCAYAKRTPVACVTSCPVCDLPYHFTERPDLPRTLYSALWEYDGTLDEALRSRSPLHLCDQMPKIHYTVFHCEKDQAVNFEKHGVRFVEAMRAAGHEIALISVPVRGHCDLPPKYKLQYDATIASAIEFHRMKNANRMACDVLYRTTAPKYDERIRKYQGCPTLAVTRGGRIYLGWYSGGTTEPHIENYNILTYSDDAGTTWKKPLLIIPSNKGMGIHALDIQLWIDPVGALHVYWVQNNTCPAPEGFVPTRTPMHPAVVNAGYLFADFVHACWEMVCDDPDADEPSFSAPRYVGTGFLRCKPLALRDGTWINFNYDQTDSRYGYSVSTDGGKTYERRYGAKKLETPFDETMAYERADGSVRMLARTTLGELGESVSLDGGKTWSEAKLSGIDAPNTRFFIARTPSGRVLLIHNDDRTDRKNMTLSLSEDDGETWKYKLCIDSRNKISYPDADFYGGRIYLTYDRERTGAKEIFFVSLTEEDIINGRMPEIRIVSKP